MKRLLLLLLAAGFGLGGVNAQTVSVTSPANCFAATFVFNYDAANSPDATGRNVYFYSNSNLEIRYNNAAGRWEIRARGGNFDVYYINSFASSPNPPDSGTSAWDDFGFCDNTGAPAVSGSGTQSTLGGDPCAALGGDSDGDGACDDNDICPGFDDFADSDSDGIPNGCDANPNIPDGVLVDAPCLDPDPILFTPSGTDGTGRNIYSTSFANGLTVRYNSTLGRWEVRASGGAMQVYLFNNFASWPNPPASAGAWQGTSVLNCNTAPTPAINGSGTQNTLGCTISIGTPSVTQPPCGGDGVISVTANSAKGSVTYSLKQGITTVSSNGTGTFNSLNAGTYTVVASDGAFPAGVCEAQTSSIILTIQDNTKPTASNPAPTTVSCPSQVPAVNTAVVMDEADNCGTPTVSFQGQTSSGIGNQASPLVITRTYRVTDAAGNFIDVTHTINVIDNVAPSLSCPSNITTPTATGQCSATVTFSTPTASDNCGAATVSLISNLGSGSSFPLGPSIVIFEAEDAVANTRQCFFTVTVIDQQNPSLVCPSNIIRNNDPGECGAVVMYTPPVGADNCSVISTDRIGGLGSGELFPVGVTTERYETTDGAGNTKECSFTVTVNDTEAPAILTCPGAQEANSDPGACSATVNFSLPTFSDNCEVAGLLGDGWDSGDLFPVGTTTVQYEGFDVAGNLSDVCSFTVTVKDKEAPTLDCVDSHQASLEADGTFDLLKGVSQPAPYLQMLLFTKFEDNCNVDPAFIDYDPANLKFDCSDLGDNIIQFSAKDVSGNISYCTVNIIVVDDLKACNQEPVAKCKDIEVNANAACQATITAAQINDGSFDPDGDALSFSLDNSGPFGKGMHMVELTVSDGILSNKCTATVEVKDVTPPVFTFCPANKNVSTDPGQCSAVVTYSIPTATDNCTSPVVTRTQGLASGAAFPLGVTLVKYQASDADSHIADCSFTVTVLDNEAATAVCRSATIAIDNAGMAMLLPAHIDGGSYDNCDSPVLSIDIAAFDCYDLGDHPVTLTASDSRGQSTSCTATVTVAGPDADCDQVADLCDLCPGGDDKVDNNNDGFADCAYFPGLADLIGDWTCGNKGNKVEICHIPAGKYSRRNTICVSPNAVAAHLAHGDFVGACDNVSCDDLANYLAKQSLTQPLREFSIFPNPASQKVRFELGHLNEETGSKELAIYSSTGQRVQYLRLPDDYSNTPELDISQLKPGIYYVQVLADGRSVGSGKLIVNR